MQKQDCKKYIYKFKNSEVDVRIITDDVLQSLIESAHLCEVFMIFGLKPMDSSIISLELITDHFPEELI